METLIYFLKGTPWYVYLVLVYLIFVMIKSVKGGVTPFKKLFFIPILFLWMWVDDVVVHIHISPRYIVASIVGILLGVICGWWQYRNLNIRVDQENKLLEIEGSILSAFLILLTFVVKYYIGYSFATNATYSDVTCVLLFFSSILTGAFVGKLIYGIYKLRAGPHVNLL
jgi:hypothetical protein